MQGLDDWQPPAFELTLKDQRRSPTFQLRDGPCIDVAEEANLVLEPGIRYLTVGA